MIGIEPTGDGKVSHWLKSAEGTLPCWSVTSKWQQTFDGSGDMLSKCGNGSGITSWSFGSKLGVMMGHGLESIKLHEEGGWRTFQSLEGEIGASKEEDGATVRGLKY